MNKEAFLTTLRSVFEYDFGCSLFAVTKEGDVHKAASMPLKEGLEGNISNMISDIIHMDYLDEDFCYDNSVNIADERIATYEIEQGDNFSPFSFLNEINDDLVYNGTDPVYSDAMWMIVLFGYISMHTQRQWQQGEELA